MNTTQDDPDRVILTPERLAEIIEAQWLVARSMEKGRTLVIIFCSTLGGATATCVGILIGKLL